MIVVFVREVTERLIFTLDFIFNERNVKYQLTNDPVFFSKTEHLRLNYSTQFFENAVTISPSSVLFDSAVFPYAIVKSDFEGVECLAFDRVTDPLASIFYVLSRMEEYTNLKRDLHNRFAAKESILFKFGWLNQVICDRWAIAILNKIEVDLNTTLEIQHGEINIIPTFDIDNTFAFKWKSGWRQILSKLRDQLRKDTYRLELREAVLSEKEKDPYDTFDYIVHIKKRGFDVRVFWLLGDYANFDKNISSLDIRHQGLIQQMHQAVNVGLHPSYKSNSATYYLESEKRRLEKIVGESVTCSRQHFLKISLPRTYQNLLKNGFTDDFSMGFADEIGFRLGTARTIRFFDLSTNSLTKLRLHPFAYMDGTVNEYKGWTVAESKKQVEQLYQEVLMYGGNFTFIWHNETIGNYGKWNGWSELLEFTLKLKDGIKTQS